MRRQVSSLCQMKITAGAGRFPKEQRLRFDPSVSEIGEVEGDARPARCGLQSPDPSEARIRR